MPAQADKLPAPVREPLSNPATSPLEGALHLGGGCLQGFLSPFLPLSPLGWLWLNASQRFTIRSTSKRVVRPTWVKPQTEAARMATKWRDISGLCCCGWARDWEWLENEGGCNPGQPIADAAVLNEACCRRCPFRSD